MQRDMDLFRAILLEIEQQPTGQIWTATRLLDCSVQDVVAHLRLIEDSGLIDARFASPIDNDDAIVIRMTNSGYDFLEASRQPTRWQQAKDRIMAAGLPITIAVVKTVLDKLINDALTRSH